MKWMTGYDSLAGLRRRVTWLVLPMTVSGCATVDPQADYQRVSESVEQSTGRDGVQPYEDEAVVTQRVSELLADGLTLDEAVEICLLNNRHFQAGWMAVGMARADLVQSGLWSNPSLGIAVRFPDGGGLANVEATLAQNIADLWQIPARKQSAERSLDQAILSLARQASDLAATTKAAYCRAVGAGQAHDIAQENLKISQQLLDTAIARQQAGAGSELDVNLARSAKLEAELSLETMRLDDAETRRDLARLLGLVTEAGELTLIDSMADWPREALDDSRTVEIARDHRLDIQAARENVARAAAVIEQQRSEVLPFLDLGVAMERGERRSGESKDGTDFIIGPAVALEIPIFDQNQAQIAKADFAYHQAVHLLSNLERQMVQDVRSAVDRAQTARKLADLADQQFVPLAERNLDLSSESYRAGKTSILSLLEAQRFLLDSRRRHVLAMVDAATAMAEVERAVGLPIEAIGSDGLASNEEVIHAAGKMSGDTR